MRMVDLIELKKQGKSLNNDQWQYLIDGYVKGDIPDYQVSAFLMAVCFQGMDDNETYMVSEIMKNSGDLVDLSKIEGIKVDKHSTGGVGDKTSLIIAPLIGACGVKMAKMAGRGLGHTGGTIDKLESIPGVNTACTRDKFVKMVNDIGICICSQSGNLVPADAKLYALRDVSATVDCLPLIATSIMSKKLASGSDTILLDVKYGSGAFMKDLDSARKLANVMINIGKSHGKDTRAIISSMEEPLGKMIGNRLEIKEVIDCLKGKGDDDLRNLCLEMASIILIQAKRVNSKEEALKLLETVLKDGSAFNKFKELIVSLGGDISYIEDESKLMRAKYVVAIKSKKTGYVTKCDAKKIGVISMSLGGGRAKKDDIIDYDAGIQLNKKIGDYCKNNEILLWMYSNNVINQGLIEDILNSYVINDRFVTKTVLIDEILV